MPHADAGEARAPAPPGQRSTPCMPKLLPLEQCSPLHACATSWAVPPAGMAAASTSGRLFSFGIISDVQYADIPDGRSFKGVQRFYRAALPALRRAVLTWRARDVDFGMHFGGLVLGLMQAACCLHMLQTPY